MPPIAGLNMFPTFIAFCIPLLPMAMFMLARLNPSGVPVAWMWLPIGK